MKIAVQTVLSVVLSVMFAAVMLAVSPVAFGQESSTEMQAPFGLKWGAKKESFSGLYNCKSKGQFVVCRTKSVPKGLSDADFYSLAFHSREGLQKVAYTSENITGDPFGTKGKERFDHLKSALSRKYPKATEDVHHRPFDEAPNQLYMCVRYEQSRCGVHVWHWGAEEGMIGLHINGAAEVEDHIELIYESPKWGGLVDSNEAFQKAQDEDAL